MLFGRFKAWEVQGMPTDDPLTASVARKNVEFFDVPLHTDKNDVHEKEQASYSIMSLIERTTCATDHVNGSVINLWQCHSFILFSISIC